MKESIEYRMGQNDVIDSDLTFFVTVKMLLKDRIDYKKIIEYVIPAVNIPSLLENGLKKVPKNHETVRKISISQ